MVKIRLMRMGAKKRPFYRVVVADSRSPRDGRFIENIGKYHPLQHPSLIDIDEERALHWLKNGAQPSEPVKNLLQKTGIWSKFTGEPPPATSGAEDSPEEGVAQAEAGEDSSEEVVAQRAGGERASSEDEDEPSEGGGKTEGP